MIPTFGDEWKRKINLGGTSSSSTQASILNRVQAQRAARAEHKQRTEAATRIQAWYRGVVEARATRRHMLRAFEDDVLGLTGLRCLVLMGQNNSALGIWSKAVLRAGPEQVYAPAKSVHRSSWLVLIRQLSLLLLKSIADCPQSSDSAVHISVLNNLLSTNVATAALGADGPSVCKAITQYILHHDFYVQLSRAIRLIPIELKSSTNLPGIVALVTLPLSTFAGDPSCLTQVFTYILTIPLLPNRLPLTALPSFTAALPLTSLNVLDTQVPFILSSTSVADKIHLASNLYMFVSPVYSRLSVAAFATYLQLCASLFQEFPSAIFKPVPSKGRIDKRKVDWSHDDASDTDSTHETRVTVVSAFSLPPPSPPPTIDAKTLKRLEKITSQLHLSSLLTVTLPKPALFLPLVSYLFALGRAWPEKDQEKVLNVVLANAGGGLVRELYRNVVRRSVLGKDASGSIMDPANASQWVPLLFLSDLYSQALLTMGDDEFFGTSTARENLGTQRAVRNPLSIDELVSFSKQLLNVAFTLYWRDESASAAGPAQQTAQDASVTGPPGVHCSWEVVREKVTRCLVGIHTRDSRKPFVPPDHWLVTSQLDMNSFVEAAVLDDQQLSAQSLPTQRAPRALSKRQIASLSPRLGVLNNIPFAIPFEVRVAIFRNFVARDMAERGYDFGSRRSGFFNPFSGHGGKARVQVRRGMVAQDGFDRLGEVDLKAPVEITFIDQFGQEEAGIDGGGVFKEFFTSLCKEVFDTDRGLWLANKKNELYPNPHAYATEAHSLNWYRFIGRILGKAMYEGILVDVAFAGFFLAKWLGRQSFLDDLSSLDPDLYNGLIFLKHYTGNLEDLALNFTIAVEEFGVTKTIDLIPNGSNVAVTKENRLQYIYLVSHYRLSKQIKQQSEAFFEGLSEMIDQKWLRMFNQQELQILIGGVNSPIDLNDLRQHTNYGGLYDDNHPVIVAFWNVVNSLDQEQRRALLRFVTSCSRPPLLGFKELIPNFSIRDAGEDQYRLPTSSTCVNLLKLPRYTSERTLREKLLQAINSNAGFDLS